MTGNNTGSILSLGCLLPKQLRFSVMLWLLKTGFISLFTFLKSYSSLTLDRMTAAWASYRKDSSTLSYFGVCPTSITSSYFPSHSIPNEISPHPTAADTTVPYHGVDPAAFTQVISNPVNHQPAML
ncbi:unnamed protein product [Lepidochelys kempii]